MNSTTIRKTEMITATVKLEDFDLPEGDWRIEKAYLDTLHLTGDESKDHWRVHVKFIRDLEV